MRPQTNLRARPARAAAPGALTLTSILATAGAFAPAAPAQTPAISVADPTLAYGQAAVVRGQAPADQAGRGASLEFGDSTGWRVVQTTTIAADGRYALSARLTRSGSVRVAIADQAAARAAGGAPATTTQRSAARRVTVAAQVTAHGRRLDVMSGQAATVTGVLRPGRSGRIVRLDRLVGRTWQTIATARTTSSGYYRLSHRTTRAGGAYVRVSFRGDAANGWTYRRIGRLSAYRAGLASYYTLYGGPLACGGRLGYDSMVVAHKTLPCGTRVTVRYRGRSVQAVVMDRGPYVGGREWDLAGAVARRLGFSGVGTVYTSI